ncbi:MFS transporter [Cryptosporangium aurantiacum]|uniref:Predicted arabinose efflux permease, MFS family n=1 Tax=Cryptosporangium aurantiacum TaxID=134849 RepID=A0A1M7H493_9ACTN|nr:MFS transporter [Cryptosporangium aurantiacum]SHM23156.1 Predicted arabinose efflux permease, MFS family [Cryptosporangium aurantiacum]
MTTISAPVAAGPRQAGRLQGVLLLLGSCLPILGAVLIAPVLPDIEDHFAGVAGAEALVPIALTIPALAVGLLAPFAGRIVDAVDRKRLLLVALVVYAIVGTAPLWLDSLPAIVASRALVGVTEAAIMTCCTTLLGDYFSGKARERWLALQTVCTAIAATLFFVLGGALGSAGWRTPFWAYAVSLVLLPLMAAFIWQPARPADAERRTKLAPVPWKLLSAPLVVTLFGAVVFYVIPVEFSYVLDELGVTETQTIGLATAITSLATVAGALTFSRVARRGPVVLLPVAFGLAAVGLGIVAVSGSMPVAVVGASISSYGTGLLLPTLVTWAMSVLTFEQRGRGTGTWTASFFIGQFVCPLIVLALQGGVGGLLGAIGVLAAASAVAAVASVAAGRGGRLPAGTEH